MAVLVLAACGARSGNVGGGRRDVVTHEQLAATNSTDLYRALEKLRPEWLTSRGPTSIANAEPSQASVYMNGQHLGTVDYLREIRVSDVQSVRYWAAGPAAARFGMGHPRGVIEVIPQQ